ncbi:MAG: peptidylprolyl isomerase [Anaerolineae bacterium]|jgi:cyclophilin family peptidyl-prolyl cis-trans isomerase/protein-disulfide isomerase
MRRTLFSLAVALLVIGLIAGCSSEQTTPSSNVPTLDAPTSVPPTTPPDEAPTSEAPTGESPVAETGPGECRLAPPPGTPVEGLPEVTEDDWIKGAQDAPITVIEYADFQCPGCARFEPVLSSIFEARGDDVRFVYRHFPLSFHEKAVITGEAAEAAGAQGAFWEMHDLLYARYQDWVELPLEQMPEVLTGYAEELDLDTEQFAQALEDHTYQDKVQSQSNDAMEMGLPGTPSFIVNGNMYPFDWGLSGEALDLFIEMAQLADIQFDSPPPEVIDPGKSYQATIRTAKGDIVIDLFAAQAPANVNSFVFLSQEGWYDGVTFHRVIPDFVAQAGDPTGTGIGNPGYQCDDEITPDLSYDGPGVVGIANAGANTGSSQFFITLDAVPELDGGYTIIGRVIEGMDVVESLTVRDPQDPEAPEADVIETILIEEQ